MDSNVFIYIHLPQENNGWMDRNPMCVTCVIRDLLKVLILKTTNWFTLDRNPICVTSVIRASVQEEPLHGTIWFILERNLMFAKCVLRVSFNLVVLWCTCWLTLVINPRFAIHVARSLILGKTLSLTRCLTLDSRHVHLCDVCSWYVENRRFGLWTITLRWLHVWSSSFQFYITFTPQRLR